VLCAALSRSPRSRLGKPTPAPNFTDAERDAILAHHNQERQAVGVPHLAWRNDLAADAQAWADRRRVQHSDISGGERPENQGESYFVASGLPVTPLILAADSWADAKQLCDADPNKKIDRAHAINDPDAASDQFASQAHRL
jgi:hypothetical protein